MWMPTHVQVTVHRATGLLTKGKNNTNDCFVTIALGKTKYQTSIKEKASSLVEWHEECELPIPDQGNTAEIVLTVLHRNFLGVDEFLGRAVVPLNKLDVYERPKGRWYTLQSKPGKESKNKERGQLEVKIGFLVKAGSLMDLSKKEKHKSSIGQLSHMAQSVGGSLLSIGSIEKRKGIKKLAKSIGSKMHLKGKKKDGENDDSSVGSIGSFKHSTPNVINKSRQTREDADPGVVSEDEDEFAFDELSHRSSGSSLNQSTTHTTSLENLAGGEVLRKNGTISSPIKQSKPEQKQDEWEVKLYGKQSRNLSKSNNDLLNRRSWESPKLTSRIEEEESTENPSEQKESVVLKQEQTKKEEKESVFTKLKNFRKDKDYHENKYDKLNSNSDERIIIGGENESKVVMSNTRLSTELLQKFENRTREDLILMVNELQNDLEQQKKKNKDLEDYLDELLLRVMETTPRILQNPYVNCKMMQTKIN